MIHLRIDWPALTRDVAFKLAGNWRQHWQVLQEALAADGLQFHRDTLRAIGSGRRRPADPDLVAWLLRTADGVDVPVPTLPGRVDRPVLVLRGTFHSVSGVPGEEAAP